MMLIEHKGKRYSTIRGSDVQRDGMFLELWSPDKNQGPLFEVFYSDTTQEMVLTTYRSEEVPLEIMEEFFRQARYLLPPIQNGGNQSPD